LSPASPRPAFVIHYDLDRLVRPGTRITQNRARSCKNPYRATVEPRQASRSGHENSTGIEQLIFNQQVVGSNPTGGSRRFLMGAQVFALRRRHPFFSPTEIYEEYTFGPAFPLSTARRRLEPRSTQSVTRGAPPSRGRSWSLTQTFQPQLFTLSSTSYHETSPALLACSGPMEIPAIDPDYLLWPTHPRLHLSASGENNC